jgi:predicted component of type VI protein secretion system
VHYTKPQFNAALQAIEDRLQLAATRTAIANDIEAAAPGVFSAAEKNTLFGIWCVTAAQRLGVT